MSKFAANTEVSVEKSRAEIEGLIVRYGGHTLPENAFDCWLTGAVAFSAVHTAPIQDSLAP